MNLDLTKYQQLPAPLNYFTIVKIQFSELHDLVNKSGLMCLICQIETWVPTNLYFDFQSSPSFFVIFLPTLVNKDTWICSRSNV